MPVITARGSPARRGQGTSRASVTPLTRARAPGRLAIAPHGTTHGPQASKGISSTTTYTPSRDSRAPLRAVGSAWLASATSGEVPSTATASVRTTLVYTPAAAGVITVPTRGATPITDGALRLAPLLDRAYGAPITTTNRHPTTHRASSGRTRTATTVGGEEDVITTDVSITTTASPHPS